MSGLVGKILAPLGPSTPPAADSTVEAVRDFFTANVVAPLRQSPRGVTAFALRQARRLEMNATFRRLSRARIALLCPRRQLWALPAWFPLRLPFPVRAVELAIPAVALALPAAHCSPTMSFLLPPLLEAAPVRLGLDWAAKELLSGRHWTRARI
jgi:hypothetical protein